MLLIYFYQLNPYLILSYFLYYPPVKDNLLTQVLSSPGDYEDIQDRLCPQEACDIFEDT